MVMSFIHTYALDAMYWGAALGFYQVGLGILIASISEAIDRAYYRRG